MKKVFTALAIVALLGATSCKKDYTCTCEVAGQTTVSNFNDAKKSDAEDACDALDALNSIAGGSCTLD